jgi:exodeoxyribonuclease-3
MTETFDPQTVLDFWFPDDGHWESLETHLAFWEYRMRGGVDDAILRDFGPITEAAAQGELDHWADTPRGRLALLIALDQFPRSYWRGTPGPCPSPSPPGTSTRCACAQGLVERLLSEEAPDVLCLQECKVPVDKMPLEMFAAARLRPWWRAGRRATTAWRSCRSCRWRMGDKDFAGCGHARHVAARLENGVVIHNFYVPAGGDVPDRAVNEKFGQKLDYLTEMRDWFRDEPAGEIDPRRRSQHRPARGRRVVAQAASEGGEPHADRGGAPGAQEAGGWVDVTRADIPEGQLYSWWSYRARDWDAADKGRGSTMSGPRPTSPGPAMAAASCGRARLGAALRPRPGLRRFDL